MIIDHLNHFATYHHLPFWKTIENYLNSLDKHSPDETTLLNGQHLRARVMSYDTRAPQDALLEAHRSFIDIQAPLIGGEAYRIYPTSTLTTQTPYNPEKDVEFFIPPTDPGLQLNLLPGHFALFLPQDAHMPMLAINNQPQHIKKVVIKIHTDLWHT